MNVYGQAGDVIRAGQMVAEITDASQSRIPVSSPYSGRILELKVDSGSQVESGTPLLSVEGLNPDGQVDLVAVIYTAPAEGKKIQPGMQVQVSPSTVRREEYGFMLGKVASVGQFPATSQGMQRVLGNPELVKTLSAGGAPIEVPSNCCARPASALCLVSRRPAGRGDSGTLCNAWITLASSGPGSGALSAVMNSSGGPRMNGTGCRIPSPVRAGTHSHHSPDGGDDGAASPRGVTYYGQHVLNNSAGMWHPRDGKAATLSRRRQYGLVAGV
jgi:pyruvate/2-oxoglutarate dehydrogenase complex dihydrolipoamide acyltransferase (E2) component